MECWEGIQGHDGSMKDVAHVGKIQNLSFFNLAIKTLKAMIP